MTPILKRGNVYQFSETIGGRRIRCSLGVQSADVAKSLSRQILTAFSEGEDSDRWEGLRRVLPPSSFSVLTNGAKLTASFDLNDVKKRWEGAMYRRVTLGDLAESSFDLYSKAGSTFLERMAEIGVRKMDEISPTQVEDYLCWRKELILARNATGGARGLTTECTAIANLFKFAIEEGAVSVSPLKVRFRSPLPVRGAKPFSPDEIRKMETIAVDEYELPYLILRWTGLRCSDVCSVTWGSWDPFHQTIRWGTKKRKTQAIIPLTKAVNSRLSEIYDRLGSGPSSPIVPLKQTELTALVKRLGKKAGIEDCHPHRWRDTFAVDLLSRGGTIYDVARVLGITVATADAHYTEFTDRLQDRVRKLLES